ncbi:hypothetical protein [Streptomyces sp. NPDC002403]
MADERYEWLDKDAAERLLRGEPVDPVGGQSCTDAERLVAALDAAARAVRPAAGELPGEAAALAAFRTATHSAGTRTRADAQVKGGAGKAARPAGAELPEPVRIGVASVGSAPSAGSGRIRSSRWSRPVRFGLVASLAGCALGGVAVAAGTGMLPGPFGGDAPLPASSVSAAPTSEELGSGITEEETPESAPPASPRTGTSAPAEDPSVPTGDPAPGSSGRAKKGDGGGERRPGGAATGSAGRAENGRTPENSGNAGSGEWYAKALKACRDYRDGKLNDNQRRKLEALAKGAHNLDLFCDRVIARSAKGQNGRNSEGEDSGEDEQGDGASNANSDSGAAMSSSVRFANGVRLPSTPVSLTPSVRTSG